MVIKTPGYISKIFTPMFSVVIFLVKNLEVNIWENGRIALYIRQ